MSWLLAIVVLLTAASILVRPSGGGLARLRGRGSRSTVDLSAVRTRVVDLADGNPLRLALPAAAAAAVAGLIVGGPVAAVVLVIYCALAIRALVRRARSRRAAAEMAALLDNLCGLAADLRAGLPPAASAEFAVSADGRRSPAERTGPDTDGPDRRRGAARITDLAAAVWRLAERTGAPAADLVERIEADARAADRARASAAAEAAGAQVTAILLAGLPIGGIALGYSIGADPLDVLLHSPIGAACAIGAVALQSAGLMWSDRLMSGAAR